jgi:glycosyltransferase involved in cell wall biosynthesis
MSHLPRITVITPTLNQGRFLERSICSVLDQGYENLEYIVIDGGSDDESLPILHYYDDRINYWRSRPDAGPADAINQALDRATGDIIAILYSDDLYLPGTLHEVARQLTGAKNHRWLVGHCQLIGEHDDERGRVTAASPASLSEFLMRDSGFLPRTATFFHRNIFQTHGRLDADLTLAFDYEMNCRLLAAGERPIIPPQLLACQREHRCSATATQTLQLGLQTIEAAERWADHLPLTQRYSLWKNCDERRRIYALAQAETEQSGARKLLWQQLLRRPWWLASEHYRQTLLHGVAHPVPVGKPRHAA